MATTCIEDRKADAYTEIAEVMGRRGVELSRLGDPAGPELLEWASRFEACALELRQPVAPVLHLIFGNQE